MFRLGERVSSKWKEMGREIGIYEDKLKSWESERRGDNKACWEEVMGRWLENGGGPEYPVTWDGMCSLLESVNYSEVAEELKKILLSLQ